MLTLRNFFLEELARLVPDAVINGSLEKRLPHNINISAPGAAAELVVAKLDMLGVAASTGTACAAGESFSQVVAAIAPHELWRAESAVRFTLGPETRKTDITVALRAYRDAVLYARRGNLVQ